MDDEDESDDDLRKARLLEAKRGMFEDSDEDDLQQAHEAVESTEARAKLNSKRLRIEESDEDE